MNLEKRDTLYGGEAFSVKTSTAQNLNSNYLTGCWGAFTKHYNSDRSTVAFTIHFNTCSPDTSLQEISDQHTRLMSISGTQGLYLWNYDIVMSVEDIRKEFAYLKRNLKSYVDYRYHTKFNSKEKRWSGIGNMDIRTNSELTLVFHNQPMYKIFLVANMYRTFLSMPSREAYFFAKNLTKSHWHKLSFVNIMLLLDMVTDKPRDSRIGDALVIYNCTGWLNAKTFKSYKVGVVGYLFFQIVRSTLKQFEGQYYRSYASRRYFTTIFGLKNGENQIPDAKQMRYIEEVYNDIISMFQETN